MTLDAARGLLACPVCGEPLALDDRPVGCPRGHRFDVARQGYLNLLGAAPPDNADTAPMIAARDRFLASGLYDPIGDAVAHALSAAHQAGGPGGGLDTAWLEVGAGTGWYLARALEAVPDARGVALDVSVAAARRAARTHPRAAAVVADVWRPLPVRTARLTAVLCVFAPRNLGEFARVLRPGGRLIVVVPNPDHLTSLRATHGLLGIDADKDDRLLRQAAAHLDQLAVDRVEYGVDASAEQVRDLIAMGPNAFHGPPAEPGAARLQVSVSVHRFARPEVTA